MSNIYQCNINASLVHRESDVQSCLYNAMKSNLSSVSTSRWAEVTCQSDLSNTGWTEHLNYVQGSPVFTDHLSNETTHPTHHWSMRRHVWLLIPSTAMWAWNAHDRCFTLWYWQQWWAKMRHRRRMMMCSNFSKVLTPVAHKINTDEHTCRDPVFLF